MLRRRSTLVSINSALLFMPVRRRIWALGYFEYRLRGRAATREIKRVIRHRSLILACRYQLRASDGTTFAMPYYINGKKYSRRGAPHITVFRGEIIEVTNVITASSVRYAKRGPSSHNYHEIRMYLN